MQANKQNVSLLVEYMMLTWKLMGGGGFFGSILTTLDSTFGGGLKLFFFLLFRCPSLSPGVVGGRESSALLCLAQALLID